ncbi:MAG: SDR family oxidoreductase [Candidatus Omnitrophica bacterium]|nr:SDR family oxidoreductase [Candidatus Omnitrophota bacterium]
MKNGEQGKSRLLITGVTGLLGNTLVREAAPSSYEVLGIARQPAKAVPPCAAQAADILDANALEKIISSFQPNIVVHTAAMTSVDRCQADPQMAELINVKGTENLLRCLTDSPCRFVFLSTDSVFDGRKGNYTEEDPVAPLHVYGKTKRKAEELILKERPKSSLIIRTAFYGWNVLPDNNSLAEWILSNLQEGKPFKGFVDLLFSPILTNHLAQGILDLADQPVSGIVHLAGSEGCSKYEFARQLASLFGFRQELIIPVESRNVKLKVTRPRDVTLNVEKAQQLLERPMPGLLDGLRLFQALKQAVTTS